MFENSSVAVCYFESQLVVVRGLSLADKTRLTKMVI